MNKFKEQLKKELSPYGVHLTHILMKSDNYLMMSYQKHLRYAEYYHSGYMTCGGGQKNNILVTLCISSSQNILLFGKNRFFSRTT